MIEWYRKNKGNKRKQLKTLTKAFSFKYLHDYQIFVYIQIMFILNSKTPAP